MLLGGYAIGSMRFGRCLEDAKVLNASLDFDLSDKLVQSLLVMNALISTRVIDAPSRVPRVLPVGGDPQVDETIVGPIAIDVIDVPDWPLARDVKPSQPMRHVEAAIDPDMPVAARLSASRHSTGRYFICIDAPEERPNVRFISK
jgi:hypothetical protein